MKIQVSFSRLYYRPLDTKPKYVVSLVGRQIKELRSSVLKGLFYAKLWDKPYCAYVRWYVYVHTKW